MVGEYYYKFEDSIRDINIYSFKKNPYPDHKLLLNECSYVGVSAK
jgi:hypothetical protein